MDLIRLGHDIEYTSRNRKDERWQVYFFKDSPQLRQDMCQLLGQEYVEERSE